MIVYLLFCDLFVIDIFVPCAFSRAPFQRCFSIGPLLCPRRVVFTLLDFIEYILDWFLSWLPLFYFARLGLIVYLTVNDFEVRTSVIICGRLARVPYGLSRRAPSVCTISLRRTFTCTSPASTRCDPACVFQKHQLSPPAASIS